ncbi:MAG: DNA-processing protein DprA [Bacteroidia bacterium]|nr:DNA-processing protein DprA [Bacteroidia bacterium]
MCTTKLNLLALALTKGLGPVSIKNLIAHCGGVEEVLNANDSKLLRTPGIGRRTVEILRKQIDKGRAEKELEFCQRKGIKILSYLDKAYPKALKYIHDAPLVMFQRGELKLNDFVGIAIVGTRRATPYGKELARKFADFFSAQGINVISGLAYGIDICAHKAVLSSGGKTTAVLAHGLDSIYPWSHASQAARIIEQGALLTEYFTGTKPDAPHFPARNRIISGMSRAVVVIEAGESGGALITARYAFDQNREVYAIPGRLGDPFSVGCNALIRDNLAKLVSSPEEVLQDLEISWSHHSKKVSQLSLFEKVPPNLNDLELKIINVLNNGEELIDQLSIKTGIPFSRLSASLLALEFKGIIRQMPGKRYRRMM